jgi:hypothetical protein
MLSAFFIGVGLAAGFVMTLMIVGILGFKISRAWASEAYRG